ncbi:hypothetical protein Tco_0740112 [Tanacetum coccineum]
MENFSTRLVGMELVLISPWASSIGCEIVPMRRPMPSLCLGCRYSLETSLLNFRDSDVAQCARPDPYDLSGYRARPSNDYSSLAIVNVKLVGAENYKMWATAMKIALKGKIRWVLLMLKETYDKMDGLSLWREFDILTILPACVCEGRTACTCYAKFRSVKHTQLIRLMQFLMSLNDIYQLIRSTILAKDPLLNVMDAFYVVSREESHRGLHPGSSGANKSQPTAFVSKTNNNTNNFYKRVNTNNNNKNVSRGPNPNLTCTDCGLIGHTVDICYELIGYPAGFKRNPNLTK